MANAKAGPESVKLTSHENKKEEKDYETEGHYDTLMRASEIMLDDAKMDKVRAMHEKKSKSLEAIISPEVKFKSLGELKEHAGKYQGDEE